MKVKEEKEVELKKLEDLTDMTHIKSEEDILKEMKEDLSKKNIENRLSQVEESLSELEPPEEEEKEKKKNKMFPIFGGLIVISSLAFFILNRNKKNKEDLSECSPLSNETTENQIFKN